MQPLQPLAVLPFELVRDFRAELFRAHATENGVVQLVDARTTGGAGYQGQRIIVRVVDENGFPLSNVAVGFAYSTGRAIMPAENALWYPPVPWRGDVVRTGGDGQCDFVLGPDGVVKDGRAGGVTVYVLEPEYSSDVVAGCGMLADHTGMLLTFQLRRNGVQPLAEHIAELEARITALEGAI